MITIKNKDDAKKYGFKRRACAFALARKSSTNPGVIALYGVFLPPETDGQTAPGHILQREEYS